MLQRRVSPAKRYLRRTLQVVALVGTIVVGMVALALIASQTPWFKDWLRKFVVREGNQYLNGTLSIGSLGGNLFTGVELGDVAIDVNGEHVVTLKKLELKYRLSDLISQGTTIQQIRLEQPFILARHTKDGWNLANLPKKQSQEADRQGPGRSLTLPDIEIADGRAVIDDRAPSPSYNLPKQIADLDVKAGFAYEPVHYSVTLDHVSFTGASPDLRLANLTGRVGTRGDDLNVENLQLNTADSSLHVSGVVQNYLSTPNLNVTLTTPRISLPEFARVLPSLRGYDLHPSLNMKADGTQNSLRLTLDEKSEAGAVSGTITADAQAPDFAARGDVNVRNLNLAPLLRDASQKSDITAHAKLDVKMASNPADAPALERTHGTFAIDAPKVVAAGYAASGVKIDGTVAGRRVTLDARANAYGGSATARGFVVAPASSGAPVQFDLTGSASHLNLRNLPANLNAPRVATDINASAFHAAGSASQAHTDVAGGVTMGQSTIQGGTITEGTAATFRYAAAGPRSTPAMSYTAKGGVRNVDLYAVGQAFRVAALEKPDYRSRINADFDVRGTGTTPATMTVDANTTVSNSTLMGGTVPNLALTAHLADGGVEGRVNGTVRGFDPGRVTGQDKYKGTVNATVNATFGVRDINAPITADAITADGQITLNQTNVAGLRIDTANIDGNYASNRGNLRQAVIKGPDLDIQASGPIALDRTGNSNVKFHVTATDLAQLAKLGNVQGVSGSATIDGTLTGNAASLRTTGTLDGSNLGYQNDKALDLNSTFDVTVPNLTFAQAEVKANTKGTYIQAGGLQINDLQAGTTYANQKLDFQVHVAEGANATANGANATASAAVRELDAGGTVLLHTDHQEIHLPSLILRTQGIQWQTAPGANATIQYGNDRVQVQDLRLVSGNQSLAVDGAFSLDGNPQPGALTVNAQNVDLSQVDKLAMLNRGISGTLNANAKLTGTSKAPAVDGRVEISNGGFQQFKYQSLTAMANYNAERVVLDAKLTQSPGVELTAAGTVPMSALKPNPPGVTGHVAAKPGDQLDLRVQSSRIDLGIVQSFTTAVTNVAGTLQADVRVTGSGEDPHLNGFVDINGGAFAVPDAGTSFTGLTTRIELQPDRIVVPQFRVLDQHGDALTIGGQLAVHERSAGAVNVSVDADNFKLMDNELGDVHVETHLKLTGDVRHPRLEGDLNMDQARLELDQILLQFAAPYSEQAMPDVVTAEDATVNSSKGTEQATEDAIAQGRQLRQQQAGRVNAAAAPTEGIGQTGALAPVALNLHITVPDNMVVRGDDLRPGGATAMQIGSVNATVGADLRIRKNPGGPITIRGTANTVRGFYEFQGRRFTLVRDGHLQFTGLPDINPTLDLSATRLIPNSGVTAIIHVTGTLRAPELNLSSDPAGLDESDILSLIIFNRNVNELGTGERASLAETAGGIASGFIASPLSRSVGKALDVDLFEITTSDPETGENAGGVTLGKQVNDKTFVKFRQQFGSRSFTQFELEYDLTRFLRIDATVAPETTAAANRLTQRRVQKATADLLFFFSY